MTAPSFATAEHPPPTPVGPPEAPTVKVEHQQDDESGRRPSVALVADGIAAVLIVGVIALMIPAWRSIFADLGFVTPVLLTSAVVVLTVLAASRRAWSVSTSFVASAAVTVLALAVVHGSAAGDMPANMVEGWKALASTGLLIATDARFLVAPIVISSLGSWVAAEAVIRRRFSAPAVVALVGAHAAVGAYTISQWQPTWWFAVALTALLGLLLAVSGLTRPGGASFAEDHVHVGVRQVGSALLVVAGLSATAGGLLAVLGEPGDDRFDLRESLVRPLDISESATPLARVKAGLVDVDNSTVFTIAVDDLGPDDTIDLLPVTVLDRYDGTIWSTSARFEVAGSSLPAPVLANPSAGTATVAVALTGQYPFRFLPQAGVLQTLLEGDVAWDPVTGTVAAIDATTTVYRGRIAPISPVELPDRLGNNETSLDRASRRADLTDEQRELLNAYLSEVVDPDADPFVQLRSIQADLLSDRFGYNENAPAGHSLAALTSYLWPPDAATEEGTALRVGFAEHAAASFAVLARELGVPSRVVVGYLLEQPITAEAPEVLVAENMIHAWPEVWVDDIGWVRIEVTNKVNQSPDEPNRTPAVSASGVEANATDLPDVEEPVILPDDDLSSSSTGLRWLIGLLLLPLVYLGVVLAGKRLRRLQRRRSSADRRIAGAWHETQDRFRELGLPSSRSLSAMDVAEELDVIDLRQVGDPLVALAPTLDAALYSPQPATEKQADEAWKAAGTAIKEARKAASRSARVRAVVDPRALLRR